MAVKHGSSRQGDEALVRRGLAMAGSDGDNRCATDGQRAKSMHRTERAVSNEQCGSEFVLIP